MKKYFLDQKYKSLRMRINIVLSVVAFLVSIIISFEINGGPYYHVENHYVYGCLSAICIWAIYFTLRWILKALPDKNA